MNVFLKDYIKLDLEAKNKKDALTKISKFAVANKITSNQKKLVDSLLEREHIASTGFENGFAIPHTRDESILKTAFLFISFKKPINWNSIDKKPTRYAFVILIPDKNVESDHIEILSRISMALMDKEFCGNIKKIKNTNDAFELINSKINCDDIKASASKLDEPIYNETFIAVTACPVGVAHTYLAAEKLNDAANKLKINIKVETHGSAGVKNEFTQEEISKADFVIIASDIGIDLSRFKNKKIYQTHIKDAIYNPIKLIETAKKESKTILQDSNFQKTTFDDKGLNDTRKIKKSYVMKHLLTGISYMIPFVILGGICIALSVGLGKLVYGDSYDAPPGDFLYYLGQIGSIAFTLMIGVLGAYIANSIAGRAAIAPAFIVSILGNTTSAFFAIGGIPVVTAMGFIGSILFGLLIGYTVKWINTWKVPKSLTAIMPIFVIPLGVGLFYSLITMFVIGAPISWVMDKFINTLQNAFSQQTGGLNVGLGIGFGILIGAMAGFDMGGPINKVAFLTCSALITSKIYEPMGMMAAAIPIAPLGMGLCTLIFRNKFASEEKTLGVSAIIMGFIGISEGAIPFAVSDPKRAIISNVIGSAVAGAIAGAAGVTNLAAHGGPIVAILGAVGSNRSWGIAGGIGFFFLAVIVGTIVTALLYGFIRKNNHDLSESKNNDVLKTQKKSFKEFIKFNKKEIISSNFISNLNLLKLGF